MKGEKFVMIDLLVMTREQLYNEIWEISLMGVSKKYNLSYSKLVKVCKENNIPYPTSGYWTRKKMGLDVSDEIIQLPDFESNEVKLCLKGTKSIPDKKIDTIKEDNKISNKIENNVLVFLTEDERKKVIKSLDNISINNHKRMHKIISEYKNKIQEERREERKINYYNPNYSIRNYVETGYFSNISKLEKTRAMRLLSLVYYIIEDLGGKVNNDFSMQIRNEIVTIEIEELKNQVDHELTKEEARQLLEYEDKKKWNRYAYKPNIRKYDYIYNGKLKIIFGNRNYIKETDSIKLEEKVRDIIIKLYEKSEQIKVARLEQEERERIYQEEKRRKEEIKNRKITEANNIKKLLNIAEDYRIACDIRNYIAAVSSSNNLDEDTKAWIEWATQKADWFDPNIDVEDELLGKRNHEASKEDKEKELNISTSYFDWW